MHLVWYSSLKKITIFCCCLSHRKKQKQKLNPYREFFCSQSHTGRFTLEPLVERAQSPCSNTAAAAGFYHAAAPWRHRHAQLPLCCPETRCHFRNTPPPRPLDRVSAKSRDLGQTRFAPSRSARISLGWLSVPSNGSSRVIG